MEEKVCYDIALQCKVVIFDNFRFSSIVRVEQSLIRKPVQLALSIWRRERGSLTITRRKSHQLVELEQYLW